MKPIRDSERRVANIHDAAFQPFEFEGTPCEGLSYLQLDDSKPPGAGFTLLRMAPGARSTPHEHTCDEMFLVLEGELVDNDGTVYRQGDFVLLKKGTQHTSHTPNGCLLAVYIDSLERLLDP